MGTYDAGIGKMSSDAPQSQQSEQYGKDIAQADQGEGTKLGTGDMQPPTMKAPSMSDSSGTLSTSKYGDPQNPFAKADTKFYGHYLPSHFKKTNIISTKGLVR